MRVMKMVILPIQIILSPFILIFKVIFKIFDLVGDEMETQEFERQEKEILRKHERGDN